jgi:formylglycine-generating enzyme required for sulfatase activity
MRLVLRRRNTLVILALAMVGLAGAALAVLGLIRREPAFSPELQAEPIPPLQASQAASGVERNFEWQPVARRVAGLEMVLVPSGCFTMGTTEAQLAEAQDSCERFFGRGRCPLDFSTSEQPAHQVCLPTPYWIGRTEVTNRQFGSSSSTDMFRAPDWPRESVTWQEAEDFCRRLGLRLPVEAEWEFAARGPDALIYPWGDGFDLDRVVSGRLSPEEVGRIAGGASWVGAYDLSGGVEEWVADAYAPYPGGSATGPPVEGRRITRGGSWFAFAAYPLRAAYREPRDPQFATSVVGFRCAGDFIP